MWDCQGETGDGRLPFSAHWSSSFADSGFAVAQHFSCLHGDFGVCYAQLAAWVDQLFNQLLRSLNQKASQARQIAGDVLSDVVRLNTGVGSLSACSPSMTLAIELLASFTVLGCPAIEGWNTLIFIIFEAPCSKVTSFESGYWRKSWINQWKRWKTP